MNKVENSDWWVIAYNIEDHSMVPIVIGTVCVRGDLLNPNLLFECTFGNCIEVGNLVGAAFSTDTQLDGYFWNGAIDNAGRHFIAFTGGL